MSCSLCESAEVRPDANFCEECGAPLRAAAAPPPAPAGGRLEIVADAALAAVSDRGLRRERNEDHVAVVRVAEMAGLVVCDGVSRSHRPGEAARMAALAVAEALPAGLPAAVQAAQAVVRDLAPGTPRGVEPPASTLVAALARGRDVSIAWLGDSRAYFIGADGPAVALTRDHSWVNREVDAGRLSEEEARRRPEACGVLRTLGGLLVGPEPDLPSFAEFAAPGPGWLLLCSDGWWTYHPDPALLARLFRAALRDTAASPAPALALARLLVEAARRAGGRDNISVAVLRLDGGATDKATTATRQRNNGRG